jgi:Protein of unknown function (DUF1572)
MAHEFTDSYITDAARVFRMYKRLGEGALEQISDEALTIALDSESNSIAVIVKHMTGNMRSRWTDFLTTDGEKPDRNRDTEFRSPATTRVELMAEWEAGWKCVFDALAPLTDADLGRTVSNSQRAAFGDAGRESPVGALFLSRRADCFSREASGERSLDVIVDTAREVWGDQFGNAGRRGVENFRNSRRTNARGDR